MFFILLPTCFMYLMYISYSFFRLLTLDRSVTRRNKMPFSLCPVPLFLSFCLFQHSVPYLLRYAEVAGGFTCPAAGEVSGASGSFSRHAHPEDCRKYYICLEGIAREYGCPIGTVFKIGDADGSGACEDPEDVPGWWVSLIYVYTILPWNHYLLYRKR